MALIGASADDERVVNASTQVVSSAPIVGLFCSNFRPLLLLSQVSFSPVVGS